MDTILRQKIIPVIVLTLAVGLVMWNRSARQLLTIAPVEEAHPASEEVRSAPTKLSLPDSNASSLATRRGTDTEALHLKLKQWHEASASDAEIDLDRLTQEMVGLLTDDNIPSMLRSLSPEDLDTPFASIALRRWMQLDPKTASTWAAVQPRQEETSLLSIVAEEWANHPVALRDYADELPATPWKEAFLTTAGLELSMKDPEGAIELAQRIQTEKVKTHLLQAVVCDWVSREPSAALSWIIDVHEPALREALTAAASKAYAMTEPQLAASWLITSVRSPEVAKEAVLNIMDTWGARDPEKAARWAATTLAGDTRSSAIEIVSSHWLNVDQTAATAWLQSLPIPSQRPLN